MLPRNLIVADERGGCASSPAFAFWELAPLLTRYTPPRTWSQAVAELLHPPWPTHKERRGSQCEKGRVATEKEDHPLLLNKALFTGLERRRSLCKGLPIKGQTGHSLSSNPYPTPIPIGRGNPVLEAHFVINDIDCESFTQTFFGQMGKLKSRKEKEFARDDNNVRGRAGTKCWASGSLPILFQVQHTLLFIHSIHTLRLDYMPNSVLKVRRKQ